MLKHIFRISTILILALLCLCAVGCEEETPEEICDHIWKDASCSFPATCYLCGETGEEYGDHSYALSTCTEAMTCRYCGFVYGEPLGHDFYDASCTSPKRCWRCNLTEGEALGHEYSEPTCTEGSECIRCHRSGDEEALGHKFKMTTCTVCNETVTVTNGEELIEFLNDNVNYIPTPFGNISVSFDSKDSNGVFEIRISSGHLYVAEQKKSLQFLIYTEGGDTYEDGKQAFLNVLDFEMDIARLAESVLPNQKISIYFFESGYQYPTLGAGYHSDTYLPFQNYGGSTMYGLETNEYGICDWYMTEAGVGAFLNCSQALHQRPCRLHAEIKAARPEYHLYFYRYIDGIILP